MKKEKEKVNVFRRFFLLISALFLSLCVIAYRKIKPSKKKINSENED